MVNFVPCIFWPLVLGAAVGCFLLWRKIRDGRRSWVAPVVLFLGILLVSLAVVQLMYEEWWWERLYTIYIPQ